MARIPHQDPKDAPEGARIREIDEIRDRVVAAVDDDILTDVRDELTSLHPADIAALLANDAFLLGQYGNVVADWCSAKFMAKMRKEVNRRNGIRH